MNHSVKIPVIIVLLICFTLWFTSCKKDVTLPVVRTTNISDITQTTATLGGNVTGDGGSEVTSKGVCWDTAENPTIANSKTSDGTGTGPFKSSLTQLTPNTNYYVRAYATNSAGTGYGYQGSFATTPPINFNPNLTYGSVSDIEGNIYKTIQIGSQIWMAENLKVTKYRDGSIITNLTNETEWAAVTTGAYCWNGNNIYNKITYGALYNYYTVVDSRNLCPISWHVPSDAEWTTLTTYLGGYEVAGGKLKETGTINWSIPNSGATNETGFTALPGGLRDSIGTYFSFGSDGIWWSSTEYSTTYAWLRVMSYYYTWVLRCYDSKRKGFSVRCIRNL